MPDVTLSNDGEDATILVDGIDLSDKVAAGGVRISQDATTRQWVVELSFVAESLSVDLPGATVYQ